MQWLLQSEWNVAGSRPRRDYRISEDGAQLLQALSGDWNALVAVMDELLNEV